MTSSRLRAGIIIGVIALCSALAGAAVERSVVQKVIVPRRPPPLPPATGRFTREADTRRRSDLLDRMTHDLELTQTQRASIDSVMQHSDSLLHGIRLEIQPRVEQVLANSRAAIDSYLEPEQRVKYEKMVAERRQRRLQTP